MMAIVAVLAMVAGFGVGFAAGLCIAHDILENH